MFIQDVTGASVDAPDALTYPACPQCHKKVQGMTCASHGQIPADQIENRYLVKISVADHSTSGVMMTAFHDAVVNLMKSAEIPNLTDRENLDKLKGLSFVVQVTFARDRQVDPVLPNTQQPSSSESHTYPNPTARNPDIVVQDIKVSWNDGGQLGPRSTKRCASLPIIPNEESGNPVPLTELRNIAINRLGKASVTSERPGVVTMEKEVTHTQYCPLSKRSWERF